MLFERSYATEENRQYWAKLDAAVEEIKSSNLKKEIQWRSKRNYHGSIVSWHIAEPYCAYINIFPINNDNGTTYRVYSNKLKVRTEYATLELAKEAARKFYFNIV